jgi:hypothetical protein
MAPVLEVAEPSTRHGQAHTALRLAAVQQAAQPPLQLQLLQLLQHKQHRHKLVVDRLLLCGQTGL